MFSRVEWPMPFLDSLTLRMDPLRSRETTVTITSQHGVHIPEPFNICENDCENVKSLKDFKAGLLSHRTATLYKSGYDPTRIIRLKRRHVNTVRTHVDTQGPGCKTKNM